MPRKGIFGSIDTDTFVENAEELFKKNLLKNPVYPFEEVDHKVYIHIVQFGRLYVCIAACVIVFLSSIIAISVMKEANEYIILAVLIFLGFFYQVIWSWKTRTYILDSNNKIYEFYRGKDLIYRGDYHNVYIRVKGVKSGGGKIYYSVVLNGFKMDEEAITPQTTEKKLIARYAKRLARTLEVNFFDSDDVSKEHVIIHRCPYWEEASPINV